MTISASDDRPAKSNGTGHEPRRQCVPAGANQATPTAARDPLTELPDRALFRDRMTKAISGALRDGRMTGVLCLGLDNFKRLKERFGGAFADRLLMVTAERMAANVRSADTVARLDDDQFGIVAVSLERPEGTYALVRRLLDVFAQPFQIDAREIVVEISIGITLALTEDEDPETWLQQARLAQDRAKLDGPSGYRFFDPELDAALQERLGLERDLRRALIEDQLELHYQPIVVLSNRHIVAFEALMRWRHPARGLLGPGQFLQAAEDSGQIVELGAWALRQACLNAATWPSHINVAVNLSLAQLRQNDLADIITDALQAAAIEPSRLELEVTEDVLDRGKDQVFSKLHALESLGIGISMDDFGTGPSSLSLLQNFPFDRIKIDQALMAKVESEPVSEAIVRAVINVGRSFGMRVTAEGIETEGQLELLRAEECDEVQGFYFSRPLPCEDLHRLIDLIAARRDGSTWPCPEAAAAEGV